MNIPTRDQLDPKDQWCLEDIFPSNEAWEAEFSRLKDSYPELCKYQGKLNNKADILAAFKQYYENELSLTRLFVYARMRRDENNAASQYQAMTDRAGMLSVEIGTAYSFITPEITRLSDGELKGFLDDPDLYPYRRYFIGILRDKEHILSDAEERLLALMGDMADSCDTVFSMLNDADLRFPSVKDAEGNDIEITHGRYRMLMESPDRRVRQETFEGMYGEYEKHINTLAATYSGSIKTDVFYAKARKHPSALEASLNTDNVPLSVYDNLISAIHGALPVMYRYMDIRKKHLNLDEQHMYDIYLPLIEESNQQYTYAEACDLVLQALAPLGEDYQQILKQAYSDRWIDVYENRGKTSGAYSWGVYGVHPFVLLNFQGQLDDVFTLAHELGHAIHSYKSNEAQPFPTASYRILVAEVASTVNEVLLLKYMIARTDKREEKLYLLNHYLDQFRTTVFRQTMFAEYEKLVHEKSERGESLTAEVFNEEYLRLNQLYYGEGVVSDEKIALEWSRIPHFYRAFYVYKYATGFSSAVTIANRILTEGQSAVDDYMKFLSAGGSMDPLDILRLTGVDLTSPEPVEACMKAFEETLNEFEALLNKE